MMNKIKKYLLFPLILFLPVGALAASVDTTSTYLHFLTPPMGDYSMSLLTRIFGTMGSTTQGGGNVLLGVMIGVFNAFWVVALGLAVLYTVYKSVVEAAEGGEAMNNQQHKKSIFTIIKIVIGFCLVAPNQTTGYSMAQGGVIWVVSQGVGLADQISQKLYAYLQEGGSVFETKTATVKEDITPLLVPEANILKMQICMFKLKSILDAETAAQKAINPNSSAEYADVGYSINPGMTINSQYVSPTITLGTLRPESDPNSVSQRYHYECGMIKWSSDVPTGSSVSLATARLIQQQAVTEMFLTLLPIAKEIAAVDLSNATSESERDAQFKKIMEKGAMAMAMGARAYTTVIDPLRQRSKLDTEQNRLETLDDLYTKGWINTPLMLMWSGMVTNDPLNILNSATPTTLTPSQDGQTLTTGGGSGPGFDGLSADEKSSIITLMQRINTDAYVANANVIVDQLTATEGWADIDFEQILEEFTTGSRDVGAIADWLSASLWAIKGPLVGLEWASDKAHDFASLFVEGFNILTNIIPGVGNVIGSDAVDYLKGSKKAASDAILSGVEFFDGVVADVRGELKWSEKGGMNKALYNLTSKAGPAAPIFTAVMTNMIGRGMESLDQNLFSGNYNAFSGSVKMGGEMMVSALQASFQFAAITFGLQTIQGIGEAVADFSIFGVPIGKIFGGLGSLAGGASTYIGNFTGFYVSFAAIFFLGGIMLYILLPLTFIIGFTACAFRWISMVFVNVITAPIFCFNLIRADSDGIGKGEKYLSDLARTALMPAILMLGAVAFIILFNIAFLMITSIIGQFIPLLLQSYQNDILMAIVMGVMLLIFAMVLLWIAQELTNICTSELVQAVERTIGDGFQRMGEISPTDTIRQAITSGSQQITGTIAKTTAHHSGGTPKPAAPKAPAAPKPAKK